MRGRYGVVIGGFRHNQLLGYRMELRRATTKFWSYKKKQIV